jgi:hypothetical protein
MTEDGLKFPNWWKVGRRASFVVCVGDVEAFDAWMAGPQGQALARHLARYTRWRMVEEPVPGHAAQRAR